MKRAAWQASKRLGSRESLECVREIQIIDHSWNACAWGKGLIVVQALTPYQQREAWQRREQGELLTEIARTCNVSPATISRIKPPQGRGHDQAA